MNDGGEKQIRPSVIRRHIIVLHIKLYEKKMITSNGYAILVCNYAYSFVCEYKYCNCLFCLKFFCFQILLVP